MAKKTIGKEKYIIGIDSGATSSEVLIVPFTKTCPALDAGAGNRGIGKKGKTKKYPPINFNVLGFEETVKRLIRIIRDSSKKIGLKNAACIVAGISGARNEKDRAKLAKAVSEKLGFNKIKILPDTEIAFYSVFAHNQTNCGILIAGTGSILYYKSIEGKMNRIGGWGRILGDEGGGWWIAKEALSLAVRNFDSSPKDSRLTAMLSEKFGLHKGNILEEIYHRNFEISEITREVFRLAERNDIFSREIIKQAADQLTGLFFKLGRVEFTIALCGSLFTEEKLLEKYLLKIAKKKFPNVSFVKPKQKPVWGAVLMGKSLIKNGMSC